MGIAMKFRGTFQNCQFYFQTRMHTFFLCLSNIFTICVSCMNSPHPILPHHVHLMEMNTYATYDQCNFTLIAPRKIINPYKKDLDNFVQQKPFGSFCLKCSACLAVADQLAKTIGGIMKEMNINEKGQDFTNEALLKGINDLCSNGFKNFDLRKYNEDNMITNRLKCTEHINTQMDGSWTKKLREMCSLYTSYMDLKHLSNSYINKTKDLIKNVCRGSGVFRDCQNIEMRESTKNLKELEYCEECKCEHEQWDIK